MNDKNPPAQIASSEHDGLAGANSPALRARILLVDDQPSRLLTYESILSGLAVECVWAFSGTEALGRLLKDDFAVVLLDVFMPGLSGYDGPIGLEYYPTTESSESVKLIQKLAADA